MFRSKRKKRSTMQTISERVVPPVEERDVRACLQVRTAFTRFWLLVVVCVHRSDHAGWGVAHGCMVTRFTSHQGSTEPAVCLYGCMSTTCLPHRICLASNSRRCGTRSPRPQPMDTSKKNGMWGVGDPIQSIDDSCTSFVCSTGL